MFRETVWVTASHLIYVFDSLLLWIAKADDFSEAFLSFSTRIHQMALKINLAKYVQCGWKYDRGADKNMFHCFRELSLGDGSVMYTERERKTMWMSTESERVFVHISVEILSWKLQLSGHEVTDIFFLFQLLIFFSLYSIAIHAQLQSVCQYKQFTRILPNVLYFLVNSCEQGSRLR